MKRLLTSGFVLLTLAGTSFAQSKRAYVDDIYYDSKAVKEEVVEQEEEAPQPARETQPTASDDAYSYSEDGDNADNRARTRSYEDEDYASIDDDYYYSTQINRFNYPFYNRPYWSSFYNPNWYDPFWVDPYWGWSPWTRPGLSMSIGMGPYWTSYWGWQSWYGFGGFSSYYGGPMYGFGGGYYTGFWNGYYAGLYGSPGLYGGRSRSISYGPRYSLNAPRNAHINSTRNSFRRDGNNLNTQRALPVGMAPRNNTQRIGNPDNSRGGSAGLETGSRRDINGSRIESIDRSAPIRSSDAPMRGDRNFGSNEASPRSRWNSDGAIRQDQGSAPVAAPRRERGGFFGGRSESAPSRNMTQPRMEQRSFPQPRMEQRSAPAPRMEAPSRSFGNGGGSRSFGGSGGGGIRGGRR